MNSSRVRFAGSLAILAAASASQAFFDDFNGGASPLWGNQRGSWTDAGGVYNALLPSNSPTTYSDLPFAMTDFTVDVDVNGIRDGGIWLRSAFNGGAESGILLVTGGNLGTFNGLYWHVVNSGSYSGSINAAGGLFNLGDNVHLTVKVVGNTYSAYVNGSGTAATTLVDNTFASGRVGLYDFSDQTFDNFGVDAVPEPATMAALGMGALGLLRRRRK